MYVRLEGIQGLSDNVLQELSFVMMVAVALLKCETLSASNCGYLYLFIWELFIHRLSLVQVE